MLLFLAPLILFSGDFDFEGYFKQKAEEYHPEAVKIRRHLHQIPELCFNEKQTSAYIRDFLEKCGLEVETGIAGTGIKAILRGRKDSPVVGIRADMDALPITENTGLGFSSRHKGVMHACGHDGHMTNVLMAAKLLSEVRDKLPGTIVFLFQPCEEGPQDGGTGGADRMIEAGVLENPKIDAMLGLHVMPGYPVGSAALREGAIMANVATVLITIKGKASHGAYPHEGIDAVYAASSAVLQFQSLISRRKDPKEQGVLSIGKINGGVRPNVIADKVEMAGTVRTFSFETESMIEKGMENILKGLQLSHNIEYEFKFIKAAKYVKNDPMLVKWVTPVFKRVLGESNVFIAAPVTVGEDFAAYSHKVPGLFFFLGAGDKGKLHTPTFAVDEKMLIPGPQLFASGAVELLKHLNSGNSLPVRKKGERL